VVVTLLGPPASSVDDEPITRAQDPRASNNSGQTWSGERGGDETGRACMGPPSNLRG
jgi:hypothetical protein